MEPKAEEKVDTEVKKEDTASAHVQPPKQTQPPIEDPKSLITKIDNRFKTKVIIFLIRIGRYQHKRSKLR